MLTVADHALAVAVGDDVILHQLHDVYREAIMELTQHGVR